MNNISKSNAIICKAGKNVENYYLKQLYCAFAYPSSIVLRSGALHNNLI